MTLFYYALCYTINHFIENFSLNTCPSTTSSKDCSGHGICIESVCTCDAQFTGEACHIPICPNKCTASNGVCDQEQHRCVCNPKYKGKLFNVFTTIFIFSLISKMTFFYR